MSYNEQRELAALPATIEQLEAKISALHQSMADPDFYRQPSDQIASQHAQLSKLEDELALAYTRWEDLEQNA